MVISSSGSVMELGIEFTSDYVVTYVVKKANSEHPTAGSLDSQSVKTTSVPSSRGFDAGKKIMGRNRHILVDTP